LVVVVSVDPEMVGSTPKQTHDAPLGEKTQQETNMMKEASSLDPDHKALLLELNGALDEVCPLQ